MMGLYFSGTGNSRYAVEQFLKACGGGDQAYAIEKEDTLAQLAQHDTLVFAYPVQYSDVPMIVRQFVSDHAEIWQGKRVFIIATMALFSGDGAGVLARLLMQHGAEIMGGLHLIMPDSIADEKALKRSPAQNRRLLEKAEQKIAYAAARFRNGKAPRQGLGLFARMAGFFTQRLWFGHQTRVYHSGLKIDAERCVGCGKCAKCCPTGNISMDGNAAKGADRCTLCYRCVNLCPKQAITLLGKTVVEQTSIEKYH